MMGGSEHGFVSFWWLFPILMFVMIIACIFMMRGCSCMPGRHNPEWRPRRSETGKEERPDG